MSLTEETFFEQLGVAAPEAAAALKRFLGKDPTRDIGISFEVATKSAIIRWNSPGGKSFSLGGVDLNGRLITYSECWTPSAVGQVHLAHVYLEDVASLVKGVVRKTKTPENWYVVSSGTILPQAIDALNRPDEWLTIIERYQSRISDFERQ